MPIVLAKNGRIVSGRPNLNRLASLGVLLLALSATQTADARMYKCADAQGRTSYTDQPCRGDPATPQWKPKQPLNVVSREALTGRKSQPADGRPGWLKPIDPVGDCTRKGGKIDKELRACMLP